MMAWSSAIGFIMCILALSWTVILASQSMNGGRRLLTLKVHAVHYWLVGWGEWVDFHHFPCLCEYVGMFAYYSHICMAIQF